MSWNTSPDRLIRSARSALLAAAFVAFPAAQAAAQDQDFVLQSASTSEMRLDVAVLPFTGSEALEGVEEASRPDAVLRSDFELSGRFRLHTPGRWDTAFFAANGVSAVAQGDVRRVGGEWELHFKLVDPASGQLFLDRTYSGSARDIRRLSHRFSDDAVFQLFGERGIASTRIAFVATRTGNKEIWVVDYDGFNLTRATRNGQINLSPTWDMEGRLIYTMLGKGSEARLLRQSVGGKAAALIPGLGGMQSAATVNPVNGEIAFSGSAPGQSEIYRWPPGGNAVRLTISEPIETSPTWSPNGYELAFTSDRSGKPQLYAMDRDGSNVRRLTYRGSYNDQAAWSPMGDQIAFARLEGGFQVYSMTVDGREERPISLGENPEWSPDGRHIVFQSTRGGRSDLWIARADGSSIRQITFFGGCSMPAWSR